MKILIFLLLSSFPVFAQMPDVLSGLAVQGVLTNQSVQSTKQGLNALKKNQILQDLQMASMEIKTRYFGNYQGVNKNSISYSVFNGLDYTIGSDNNSSFYIKLYNIDEATCFGLMNAGLSVVSVQINGNNSKDACISNNKIKFIFN